MTIKEGDTVISVGKTEKISKQMEVFYNPVMKLNRSISVLVVKSFFGRKIRIADILAGSGIRSIRFLKEAGENIESIDINDSSERAVKNIKNNLRLNKINIKSKKIKINISNKEANKFLLAGEGFDYIEIDPFGSPNPFLDSAIKRISRNGILAVTATDTAALTGTYENACKRKYWAKPMRNYLMHEIGIRILIRKIQLIGAQYEKALIPVLSYSKEHYYRISFKCEKGKQKCDEILKEHKFLGYCKDCQNIETFTIEKFRNKCDNCSGNLTIAGPVWTGQLGDYKLAKKMLQYADQESSGLLEILKEEYKIPSVGFFSLDKMCKLKRKKQCPKVKDVLEKLRKNKIPASRTHFGGEYIKVEDLELLKTVF